MLSGGRELAVTAAAASLCASGALAPGAQRGTLAVVGSLPVSATPLEWELFDTVRRHRGITNRELKRRVAAGPEARALARGLVQGRLLVNPKLSKLLPVFLVPLLGLGIARLVAGIQNHKPIGYLLVLLLMLAALTWKLTELRHQPTRAGEAVLRARRERAGNAQAAAVEATPALAVALFGALVLWTLDPAIASGWVPPPARTGFGGGGGFSGGGFGGGGGGGGCGG